MARNVRTTDERAVCPMCGADLGPLQPADQYKLWCRHHGWVFPSVRGSDNEAPSDAPD